MNKKQKFIELVDISAYLFMYKRVRAIQNKIGIIFF